MFCLSGRTKGWIYFPHTTHFEDIFKEMAIYFPQAYCCFHCVVGLLRRQDVNEASKGKFSLELLGLFILWLFSCEKICSLICFDLYFVIYKRMCKIFSYISLKS